jgi:hypothetical protein
VVVAERVAGLSGEGVVSAPQTSVLGAPAAQMWLPPRLRLRADDGRGVLIRPDSLVPFDGSAFGEAVARPGVVDALPGVSELCVIDAAPWERLLGGGGETWEVARRPATVLRRIEPSTGELRELGPGGLDPVMDADGRLAWLEGSRLHVDGEEPVTCEGTGRPIGLAGGRTYLAHGAGLTVVEPDGSVAWRFAADGIVPGSSDVVIAHVADGALQVDGRSLPLPSVGREVAWRLIAADDDDYVLWGGARGPAVLAVLDDQGGVVKLDDPAPEDARLGGWWPAPPYEWQVDSEGRVHVVLAGPDGIVVARLTATI